VHSLAAIQGGPTGVASYEDSTASFMCSMAGHAGAPQNERKQGDV